MTKICKKGILLFVFVIGIVFSTSSVYPVEDQIINILERYARLIGEEFDKENVSSENISSINPFLEIRRKAREGGLFVDVYKLSEEEFLKLWEINLPFMVFLNKGEELCLVEGKLQSEESRKIYLDGKKEEISADELFKRSRGMVLMMPLGGIELQKIYFEKDENNSSKEVFIIYVFHDSANFKDIKKMLDKIYQGTAESGGLIYIDELGLIPEKTIEWRKSSSGLEEEEVFNKVKEELANEVRRIKDGIPVPESSPLYGALYRYLAERKIESVMEDLKYDNWKIIVSFDSYKLIDKAITQFLMGAINHAIKNMNLYIDGFMLNNHLIRDKNFVSQINDLLGENPDKLIFTIRGLAHYGFEEKLVSEGIKVRIFITTAQEIVSKLIPSQHYIMLLRQNNVHIKPERFKELTGKSILDYILIDYYMRTLGYKDYPTAVIEVNELLKDITWEDIILLCRTLFVKFFKKEIDKNNFREFIYNWIKKQK